MITKFVHYWFYFSLYPFLEENFIICGSAKGGVAKELLTIEKKKKKRETAPRGGGSSPWLSEIDSMSLVLTCYLIVDIYFNCVNHSVWLEFNRPCLAPLIVPDETIVWVFSTGRWFWKKRRSLLLLGFRPAQALYRKRPSSFSLTERIEVCVCMAAALDLFFSLFPTPFFYLWVPLFFFLFIRHIFFMRLLILKLAPPPMFLVIQFGGDPFISMCGINSPMDVKRRFDKL